MIFERQFVCVCVLCVNQPYVNSFKIKGTDVREITIFIRYELRAAARRSWIIVSNLTRKWWNLTCFFVNVHNLNGGACVLLVNNGSTLVYSIHNFNRNATYFYRFLFYTTERAWELKDLSIYVCPTWIVPL